MSIKTKSVPTIEARIRRKTIISFTVFFLMIGLAWIGWITLFRSAPASDDRFNPRAIPQHSPGQ